MMKWLWNILFVLHGMLATGQDIHFSHFYAAPLHLNPAMTGYFDGSLRMGANFRNQWQSVTIPYRTVAIYGDYDLLGDRPGKNRFGAGLLLINDQAGDGHLLTQKAYISAAYHANLGAKIRISLGAGSAFVQKKIDFNQFIFDDQWTAGGFDLNLPTGEPIGKQSLNYMDIHGGAMFTWMPGKDLSLFGGANMAHILQPDESFINSGNKLGMRKVIHGGADIRVSPFWEVQPAVMYMDQKKAAEWMLGFNAFYQLKDENKTRIIFGSWWRGSGDGIPVVGLEYRRIRFLMSYDINTSSLKPASNYRGGAEVSLRYIMKKESRPGIIIVPCIRY